LRIPRRHTERDGFLNVDLDVHGSGVGNLVRAFGDRVIVLHVRRSEAHFELAGQPATLEEAIRRFVRLIRALPSPALDVWRKLAVREFSAGFRLDGELHSGEFSLSSSALRQLADIGGDLVITVYREDI
jgi:hypothetical protein